MVGVWFFFLFLFFPPPSYFLCNLISVTRTDRMLTLPNRWSDLLFPAAVHCAHTEPVDDTVHERHVDSGRRMLTVQFKTFNRIQLCTVAFSHFLLIFNYWHLRTCFLYHESWGAPLVIGLHKIIGQTNPTSLWLFILFLWRMIQNLGISFLSITYSFSVQFQFDEFVLILFIFCNFLIVHCSNPVCNAICLVHLLSACRL